MTRLEVLQIIDTMQRSVKLLQDIAERLKKDPELREQIMDEKLKRELINDYMDRAFQ